MQFIPILTSPNVTRAYGGLTRAAW